MYYRRDASLLRAFSPDCSGDHARRRPLAVPPAARPIRDRRHGRHHPRAVGQAHRHDRQLRGLGFPRSPAGARVGGTGQRHAPRAQGSGALRAQRARRRSRGDLPSVRGGASQPLRRHRLSRNLTGDAGAGRRTREHRMREARGGPGGGSYGVLRPGHRRNGVRRGAAALLPGWLRRPGRRNGEPVIESELLDDPRADPVAVGKELRDIARLNAWFGGTRAVVRELEPFFERSGRGTGNGKRETWTLLDIGTGLGDIPRAAVAAARRHGVELTPMGMDLSRTAARLARAGGLAVIVDDGSWLPLGPRSVS